MNRARGFYLLERSPGTFEQVPTFTCAHCQRIVREPRSGEPSGFCHSCFAPVCLPCGAKEACEPFEKKLLAIESRARLLKEMGLE